VEMNGLGDKRVCTAICAVCGAENILTEEKVGEEIYSNLESCDCFDWIASVVLSCEGREESQSCCV